uniref:Tyrosinase copper-binding domain-containing protein n=1 Tax=Heterosigma akashiwo TaxID=2829 RepID=A0A6V1TYR0_HETAK
MAGYSTFGEIEAPEIDAVVRVEKRSSSGHKSRILTVCATLVLVLMVAFTRAYSRKGAEPMLPIQLSSIDYTDETSLKFASSNEYTRVTPIKAVWEHIAEPFRVTTLEATFDGEVIPNHHHLDFTWEVDGEVQKLKANAIDLTFTTVGLKSVKLTIADSSSGSVGNYESEVVVKYVRREIRSLTDEDRKRTLDAIETIYRVDQQTGEELYGENYRSIVSFSKEHLNGAGRLGCDSWHDDAGIVTHHLGFTIEFEEVMQLIDPMISLPYWEYTIDTDLYGDNIWESPIFQDEWFSPLDTVDENHVVNQGRFAYLEIPKITDGSFDVLNPYGLLRTPWVTDPNPYLTRGKEINKGALFGSVSCNMFKSTFNQGDIATINNRLNGGAHGPVHIQIGGEWNVNDEMLSFMDAYGGFEYKLVLVFKILWRTGFARCPTTCAEGETCECYAPVEVLEEAGLTAYEAMKQIDVLKYLSTDGDYVYTSDDGEYHIYGLEDSPEEEEAVWLKILQALANPGWVGEMYTSSAPTDPTFWILHPTAERLLSARRLVKDTMSLDETWGYTHQDNNPSDNGWVCDWSNVEGWGLPDCVQGTCSGHNADDVLEFNFINFPGKQFTNQELYDYIDPTNVDLPYMYDSYNWDHCGFGVDYVDDDDATAVSKMKLH